MNIEAIDSEWLLWVNGHHSPMIDSVMWQASQATTWLPLYVLLLVYLGVVYRGEKSIRSWLPFIGIAVAFGLAAGLADYVSSGILKPLIERPRPTHNEALVPLLHIVNGYKGGMYGFPSSHAANTAAISCLFCLIFYHGKHHMGRAEKIIGQASIAFLLAGYWALNCWSRMYLGVHYPSDLIVGTLIGMLTAGGSFVLWRFSCRKIE